MSIEVQGVDVPHARRVSGLLTDLNDQLEFLARTLPVLSDEKSSQLKQDLLYLRRRCLVAELVRDEYVIAISGVQGAGKSTLVKMLYDLPMDAVIPSTLNRGEKLPIKIVERPEIEGPDALRAWVHRPSYGKGRPGRTTTRLVPESIDLDEFNTIATAPELEDIYLELHVPERYFQGQAMSLMLLPGLEELSNPEEDRWWVPLAEHALAAAATCVFVADPATVAGNLNAQALEQIQRQFGSSKPILALSFADTRNEEKDQELHDTVAERFGIGTAERDRIISTGTNAEHLARWRDQLAEALFKYYAPPAVYHQVYFRRLYDLLTRELEPHLSKVRSSLARMDTGRQVNEHTHVKNVLAYFDGRVSKLKESYEQQLQAALAAHASDTYKEADRDIKDQFDGFFNKVSRFFENAVEAQRQVEELVEEQWLEPRRELLSRHTIAMTNAVSPYLLRTGAAPETAWRAALQPADLLGSLDTPEREATAGGLPGTIPSGDGASGESLALSVLDAPPEQALSSNSGVTIARQAQEDLRKLFVPGKHEALASEERGLADPKKVGELLPVLALEYARIASVRPEVLPEVEQNDYSYLRELGQGLEEAQQHSGTVIKAVGLFLGLDSLDGDIDSIPALAGALKAGGALAAKAVPAAGAVAALAAVVVSVKSVREQLNKMELDKRTFAQDAMEIYQEATLRQSKQDFNQLMMLVRDHLEDALLRFYRVDETFADVSRLHKAAVDTDAARKHLEGALLRVLPGLG